VRHPASVALPQGLALFCQMGVTMDSKIYIEWRARGEKWVVENRGQVLARFDTKLEAKAWVRHHYPGEGFEEERVQVRDNSPYGAKPGQWTK